MGVYATTAAVGSRWRFFYLLEVTSTVLIAPCWLLLRVLIAQTTRFSGWPLVRFLILGSAIGPLFLAAMDLCSRVYKHQGPLFREPLLYRLAACVSVLSTVFFVLLLKISHRDSIQSN